MLQLLVRAVTSRLSEPFGLALQYAYGLSSLRVSRRLDVHFDLIDLALFRHVVEAGSITHGAARANLALAAASTRIRAMEADLGAALLLRGRSGVTPTAAGRTLLQHARSILSQTARLQDELGLYSGGRASEIRVLSNTNAIVEFLPEPLGAFLTANPRISVDLEERLSDEIVALVAEGVADIGIVAETVAMAGLETYPFRHDRFVVVTPHAHPLAQRPSVAFAEVLDHDLVGLDRTSALQRFLSGKAARIGRAANLRVQLRSFDAVCRLVERHVGLGIVPATTAARAARTMEIAVVDLADDWASRELKICVRRLADLTPNARRLVDHLRASAGMAAQEQET